MSILNITLNTNEHTHPHLGQELPEYLEYNEHLKNLYGEINTPYSFISKMLSIIPDEDFKKKDLKWLDAGAGHGNYSICLFIILFKSLEPIIPNEVERKEHIIHNMLYMVEINSDNIFALRSTFGPNANIIEDNYIQWVTDLRFDYIIGNPPYNCDGVKKVPTKNNASKKEDGNTIWTEFIKQNISLLKTGGKMNVLIPSIWMKPDKAGMYELLLKYQIERLHTLDSSEVNKLFNYHVQTPICYFLLTKRENNENIHATKQIELYDELNNNYISFNLKKEIPIPLCFASIVNKFLVLRDKYGKLNVIKTNMPPKGAILNDSISLAYPFQNVNTTTLNKSNKRPELQFKYSNEELAFHGQPKIIMAHKMYGFPYVDKEGLYGISTRDNYIINNKPIKELELIKEFLSTELILFLFETTRYRMRYLEKYVFEYIPDFSKIPEAVTMYNKKAIDIYKLIGLEENEKEYIERYYNIKYKFFE
jgi:hypothetical protein